MTTDLRADPGTLGCHVVELRQYTLHPGQRAVLIDLFEREFIEPQEAVGMTVLGQFRDLDDADRFTWLRGFRDMPGRLAGLTAFYGGPVWQAHRAAANATMIDSDNALLLRPAWPGAGIGMVGLALLDGLARSGVWAPEAQPQLAPWLARPAESRRLVPTARSALHA